MSYGSRGQFAIGVSLHLTREPGTKITMPKNHAMAICWII